MSSLRLAPCHEAERAQCLVRDNMAADYRRHGLEWDAEGFHSRWQQWCWRWLESVEQESVGQRLGLMAWNIDAQVLYLRELHVYSDRQGRGVGQQALALVELEALRLGCRYIRLRVLSGSRAEALYLRHGYQQLRRDPTPGGWVLGMQKALDGLELTA
ncbi:GNAT family N-acetyltransferase [Halomonas huangheensis]|uniref:N-acetyltransferase domain-containing protein n=1 Tax=Halomonas huangheensis TaxID=1178482 RepID=W1N7E7_9GAMM|nr:GNAT family N-acetyltransferase [Halomonas huangheensis]ALM53170.1 hypothetical protein AR456_13415 [Halomonas huangheensis]ERL51477.1 hypothetical protein BJB45_13740 [Halomonas huangheensis]